MLRPILLILTLTAITHAEPLRVITWNVESGGADPAVIAQQLAELPKVDAYLLQEVDAKDIGRYGAAIREAHGKTYKYYLSSLGGSDRLATIVDEEQWKIHSFAELFNFEEYRLNDWRHRSPLVAKLQRRRGGQTCLLVNVHLARGNADLRTEQAVGLREWAKVQPEPVVLAGDCNFDFNFHTKHGNEAHTAFFAGAVFQEAVPEQLIDTNWADKDGDGKDNYPDSCLDFGAYCSNGYRLNGSCQVIVRNGDFPDTKATSDHRPVLVTFQVDDSE